MTERRSDKLAMWTIYDHPTDFPDHFVAREWLVSGRGAWPSGMVIWAATLNEVRLELLSYGLTCLERSAEDDPAIVETWL